MTSKYDYAVVPIPRYSTDNKEDIAEFMRVLRTFQAHLPVTYTISWFLATFGDLGWGKAEGRGQKAEERKI
ncbi:MAG: hypothetical protein ICV85_13005 [Tolypothrix sp. T3-bin4]|nr:hypothetical protein [Tolypothrix sp. T3-bin4]